MKKFILLLLSISFLGFSFVVVVIPKSAKSKKAVVNNTPSLKKQFKEKGLDWGSGVYFRLFKKEKEFEVWVKKAEKYVLFNTYKICYYSGGLGTKTKQGDKKSPEGFYYIKPSQLNPYSKYHLAFNIGYPNNYEKQKGYTGSAIMVHGECVSIGCYAMGNKIIEKIYTLLQLALENNQPLVRVHIFPFRFTDELMAHPKVKSIRAYKFWTNLKEGYDFFEKNHTPPNVEVRNGKYVFN